MEHPAGQPATNTVAMAQLKLPRAVEPTSVIRIGAAVNREISRLLDAEVDRWSAVDPDLVEPLHALATVVAAGGKRLRPAFCYWGYVAAGGLDDVVAVRAGAALELLHTFALVHDDVMDESPVRRGIPTVHTAFAAQHSESKWSGSPGRFGESAAILVGDLAFTYADQLLANAPLSARQVFTELRLEVNLGQYLDVRATADQTAGRERARLIALLKSAKYTVERPLHLGLALHGRLAELGGAMSGYGVPLGIAFQLRDDLLGAFGNQVLVGKPVGADLRDGKATELLAVARERAAPSQLAVLDRVGQADITDDEVQLVQEVLVDTGAREEIEDRVARLTEAAVAALHGTALTDPARSELAAMAEFIAARDV